jgi:hypothetical protein
MDFIILKTTEVQQRFTGNMLLKTGSKCIYIVKGRQIAPFSGG